MYGADFSHRVRWVQVPEGTDSADIAETSLPVASASTDAATVLTPVVSSETTLLMAVAAADSGNGTGSYSATPLKSASSWDVSEQTGAFSWTYEMAVPTAGAGPTPQVGLNYNSQSVDGLTGSTNNQPSVVGEGWALGATGFIERSYVSCALDDGASGAVKTSGDLCWRSDNATVSMAGHSGALIKDKTSGKWKLESDDGSRFEQLVGTAAGCGVNGTESNDCWRMTTTDGTQYFFGLNRLPGWVAGNEVTNSTWTVPVYGNDTGEPCHASTFAASSCMQAWRWNLDYVVDVHGNAQTLYYTAESNKYAKGGSGATSYQRGGVLSRIDYGLRNDAILTADAAGYRVLFTYDPNGRCNDTTGAKCTASSLATATKPTTPSAYPDVPWDQYCTAASCSASQIAPTFFTNASLTKVQTQAKVSGAYKTVDTWSLGHSYPAPGDGMSAALWLTKVQRVGTAAGQAAVTEPATEFTGTTKQNRVWAIDGLAPLDKWRLSSIKTSLGAVISVNYKAQQCTVEQAAAIIAAPETNTRWCFPEWWIPAGLEPKKDLFHKYPVTSVTVNPKTGGPLSKTMVTQYKYGTPKWRYNDSPLLVGNKATWNVFAGVGSVEVREGNTSASSSQKVTKTWYYQGMYGDRANAAGGTKTDVVSGTATVKDYRYFAGMVYRQQVELGVGGSVVSNVVNGLWASSVTADDGTRTARMVNTAKSTLTEPLADGGTRTLVTATTFDGTYGYSLTVSTQPSDAAATCTTTSYATANTTAWVLGLPSEEKTVTKACADVATASYPDDLVSDVKTNYDGAAWGAAATRGLPTQTQQVDRYDGATAHWATTGKKSYDALGRVVKVTDGLGRASTTAYTPATTQPATKTVAKNSAPFSFATTTNLDPTTGQATSVVDPNGATTTIQLDGLGRTSKVWLPLQPKASNPDVPSLQFSYTLSQTAPNAIKTSMLVAGSVVNSFDLFDGLGRSVQRQTAASGGGTVVRTKNYDEQGRQYFVDNDYWTTSIEPGVTFFTPTSENNVPSQVVTTFDAIGRPALSTLNSTGTKRSETATTYLGADRVDVLPPTGGTPTSTFTNSLGQKTTLQQYLGGTLTGTPQATKYAYNGAGRMTTMTDPAGNDWTWTYDLLGNRVKQTDPDSGASSATYDLAGNMTSTTDARGKTVTTTYDEINRKTAMYSGTASGALLASWTYDTVKKGLATSSTSYTGSTATVIGKAYSTTVESYDAGGNATKKTLSIPAGAPAFAGTSYSMSYSYKSDGSPSTVTMPSMGGLPAETLYYTYNSFGRLSALDGASDVLSSTIYSPIGQLSQFTRSNGATTAYSTYGYDNATGQLLAIKDNAVFGGAGHYVADRTFTRDLAGNVTSQTIASALPTAGTQKTCYAYDGLRQLTRAWTPNAASTCKTTPSAATMGGIAPMWNDYTYDTATGNRKSMTYRTSAGVASTVSYTYPAADSARPHGVTAVAGPVDLGSGTYKYDAAGNMIEIPGQKITFNDVGKATKIVAGATTQENIYDGDGNLLLRTSTTEGSMLSVGSTTLTQAKGSTVIAGFRTYSAAEGKPVAQRSAKTGTAGSTLTWLFSNMDGTVDTQTNASTGATVRQYRDPFGVPIGGASGQWQDGRGFLNSSVTQNTGLTTVGARMYFATVGKFISVDPVVEPLHPQQNSGYAYSHNNPLTKSDPTGLRPEEGCWATSSGQCSLGGGDVVQPPTQPSGGGQGAGASSASTPGPYSESRSKDDDAFWGASGPWTQKLTRVASHWGKTPEEIRTALHDLKDENKIGNGAGKHNTDLEVNIETGDVRFPDGDGETIDNLDRYLEESHWEPINSRPEITGFQAPAIDPAIVALVAIIGIGGLILVSPLIAATG